MTLGDYMTDFSRRARYAGALGMTRVELEALQRQRSLERNRILQLALEIEQGKRTARERAIVARAQREGVVS